MVGHRKRTQKVFNPIERSKKKSSHSDEKGDLTFRTKIEVASGEESNADKKDIGIEGKVLGRDK